LNLYFNSISLKNQKTIHLQKVILSSSMSCKYYCPSRETSMKEVVWSCRTSQWQT